MHFAEILITLHLLKWLYAFFDFQYVLIADLYIGIDASQHTMNWLLTQVFITPDISLYWKCFIFVSKEKVKLMTNPVQTMKRLQVITKVKGLTRLLKLCISNKTFLNKYKYQGSMCRFNDKVYVQVKCSVSISKFNVTVKCVT